jgi:hypothetical protein
MLKQKSIKMTETLILSPISLDQLSGAISSIVRQELRSKYEEDLQEKLLSPEETCKLFVPEISIGTLNNYTNQGLLKKYYLGRLTFYKYSEVLSSLKSIKKYSRKEMSHA